MAKYDKNRPKPGEKYPEIAGCPDSADRYACMVCQHPTVNMTEDDYPIHIMCVGKNWMVVP